MLRLLAILAAAALLAGCGADLAQQQVSVPNAAGTIAGAVVSTLPATTVVKVQTATAKACTFTPTAKTVADIAAAQLGTTGTAGAIATGADIVASIAYAVCAALNTAVAPSTEFKALAADPPHVGDVVIHGRYRNGEQL